MSKLLRPLLIALVVAFLIGGALGFANGYFEARTGRPVFTGLTPILLPAMGFLFTFLILQAVGGNRKVAVADAAAKEQALAFRPAPGGALLVVFREGFAGSAVGMNVKLDGAQVAQLKSPRFTAVSLAPGEHTLSADSRSSSGDLAAEPTPFIVAEGETAVFQLKMKAGLLKAGLHYERHTDLERTRERLRSTPMVLPEGAGAF